MNDVPTKLLRQMRMSSLLSVMLSKKTTPKTKLMTKLIIAQRFRKIENLHNET